jgi:5'-3' exonuclease
VIEWPSGFEWRSQMATIVMLDMKNVISASVYGNWYGAEIDPGDFKAFMTFCQTVTKMMEMWEPDEIVFFMDRKCTARLEILPSYKGKRKRDETITNHKNDCMEFASHILPARTVAIEGYEADDLIARFSEKYHAGNKLIAVSTDKDLIQIAQEFEQVSVYDHIKKEYMDHENCYPMLEHKALTGCSSDNIPPVIGGKTSEKIMSGEIDLEKYLDEGLTRSEKLPRRIVYERNKKLVALFGEHAILPPVDDFGFDIGSEIKFNKDKMRRSMVRIFDGMPEMKLVDGIVERVSYWHSSRHIRLSGGGRFNLEEWRGRKVLQAQA